MKKFILGILIGLCLGVTSVVVASGILAKDIKYKNTNVENALDDLYNTTKIEYKTIICGSYAVTGYAIQCGFKTDKSAKEITIEDIRYDGASFERLWLDNVTPIDSLNVGDIYKDVSQIVFYGSSQKTYGKMFIDLKIEY